MNRARAVVAAHAASTSVSSGDAHRHMALPSSGKKADVALFLLGSLLLLVMMRFLVLARLRLGQDGGGRDVHELHIANAPVKKKSLLRQGETADELMTAAPKKNMVFHCQKKADWDAFPKVLVLERRARSPCLKIANTIRFSMESMLFRRKCTRMFHRCSFVRLGGKGSTVVKHVLVLIPPSAFELWKVPVICDVLRLPSLCTQSDGTQ